MSTFELSDAYEGDGVPVVRRVIDASPRQRVALAGEITDTAAIRLGSGPAYRCRLDDGTGRVDLLFVGRRAVAGIQVGTRCRVEGTAAADGHRLVIWNPFYVLETRVGLTERADELEIVQRRAG